MITDLRAWWDDVWERRFEAETMTHAEVIRHWPLCPVCGFELTFALRLGGRRAVYCDGWHFYVEESNEGVLSARIGDGEAA